MASKNLNNLVKKHKKRKLLRMTRKELAEKLEVDPNTLRNWEKNKPELIKLINAGLMLEKQIQEIEKNLNELKKIQEISNSGKLII
ncbi:MAG: helix-turn-helix domain-containing protein [Sulfurospirillaceae bacterium]|nr:helix-turn-helix domain-containing protein [Sulfurospirillaceae bacterium]